MGVRTILEILTCKSKSRSRNRKQEQAQEQEQEQAVLLLTNPITKDARILHAKNFNAVAGRNQIEKGE